MSIHAESSQQLGKSSPALSPFDFLKEELDAVDHCIRQQALAFDPAVEPYVSYVLNNGGKRIRPVLTLLSGGATGGIHEDHHKMASILELIHIATLVHDDIIDGAEIRRQAPTANAKWGPALSVLLGDALFAQLQARHPELLLDPDKVANSCIALCSGYMDAVTGQVITVDEGWGLVSPLTLLA